MRLVDRLFRREDKKFNPVDGAELVHIRAGYFIMGSSPAESRAPKRRIYLDGYFIYKNLVTVAQYRKFCDETDIPMPNGPEWGWRREDYPMVNISWDDACAYARWAGAALPTEAQWEKAASGTDGRIYPWGNRWYDKYPPSGTFSGFPDGTPHAVGEVAETASPYGVLDMVGNVLQWCSDSYDGEFYLNSPGRNPKRPAERGRPLVLRGSWRVAKADDYRCSRRTYSHSHDYWRWNGFVGFRCVIPEESLPGPLPATPARETGTGVGNSAGRVAGETSAWKGAKRVSQSTPLMVEASRGTLKAVVMDRTKSVQLAAAAAKGDLSEVRRLLASGADVDALDSRSALMHAVREGHRDVAEALLAAGTDANAWDSEDFALMLAVRNGHREMARALLAAGAGVNSRGSDGKTALMVAAANGSKEVAKLLLEHGADVDALDSDGSALMYAVRGGRREVAVALLDAGADANARAVSSETVLLQASFRGDLDLMKMLIKNGARVNARMIDSSNALIRQCGIHADLDVIRVLLDSGADLNASRHNGETALMATAEMRNWKVAKVLLENGADVNARTNDGWTALKYATRRFPGDKGGEKEGEKEMVALLRKHGALE